MIKCNLIISIIIQAVSKIYYSNLKLDINVIPMLAKNSSEIVKKNKRKKVLKLKNS